jgi:tryptophanyl-tRNA synthetase
MKKLISGIKPTGELTLGNYIGAIKQFIEFQKNYETYIFVADLHAITTPQDKTSLRKRIKDIVAIYIACGLNEKDTTIYLQSENPYHAHLGWMLNCYTYIGELNRMTQYKDTIKNESKGNITSGLYTYPVLMASDILLYDADIVPVGDDQKQHVELTRNIAERFNNKYGNVFIIPEPIIPKDGARIKDLQNPTKKMSKSSELDKGCILLLDSPQLIRKKIMSAVTDNDNKIIFDVKNKPGISNLITIYSSLEHITKKETEERFKDSNYGQFKDAVANSVIKTLEPIQKKYNELINSNVIDEILDKGIKKVLPLAEAKCKEVEEKIGLGR